MLIKTLTWHSLTYIVGISSAIAVHQAIPSPGSTAGFQSNITGDAKTSGQIVNRSSKSDKLPIREMKALADHKVPPNLSRQNALNPQLKNDCKPPIDVLGRCFAKARDNHHVS